MFKTILWVQVSTFIAGGLLFFREDDWRLGSAQLMLAAVQAVIYIGA